MRFFPDKRWERNRCISCGTCREVCPAGAVILSEEGAPEEFDQRRCIGCGHCGTYCPANCFSLPKVEERLPHSSSFLSILAARRSCRFFLPDTLSEEDLE